VQSTSNTKTDPATFCRSLEFRDLRRRADPNEYSLRCEFDVLLTDDVWAPTATAFMYMQSSASLSAQQESNVPTEFHAASGHSSIHDYGTGRGKRTRWKVMRVASTSLPDREPRVLAEYLRIKRWGQKLEHALNRNGRFAREPMIRAFPLRNGKALILRDECAQP
jgi:hypothetical protein